MAPPAFDLLQRAVAEIEARNSTPAAAGVSARMRQIDPDFTLAEHGFRSFRELLAAAEARGLIRVIEPEGASDRMVLSVSDTASQDAYVGRRLWLRRDLWQAVFDYQNGGTRVYSRRTKTTKKLDSMADAGVDADHVLAPTITAEDIAAWMRVFAEAQSEPARTAMVTALDGTNPVRDFEMEVRGTSTLERHWKRALHANVVSHIAAWADRNGIPLEDLEAVPDVTAPAPRRPVPSAASFRHDDDASLREHILRAVGAMPLSELLKLPIPVEYVLRR